MDNIFQIIPLQYLIAMIVFAPFAGALISKLSGKSSNLLGPVGIIISFLSVFIVSLALFGIKDARPSIITGEIFNFLKFSGFSFEVGFRIDELSLVCIIASSIVSLSACFFAVTNKFKNWVELNLFVGSLMLILIADNFGLIVIGWILTGAIAYSMGKYTGATVESLVFLLSAIVLMNMSLQISGNAINTLNIEAWENGAVSAIPVILPVSLFVIIACLFRMGIFPSTRWIESGVDDPISILISNALLPLTGVYLLLRIHFLLVLSPNVFLLLKYSGIVTIIITSILASKSLSVKRTLAMSSAFISGLIVLSVGFGGFAQALILCILHVVLKGAMSLTSGPSLKDQNGGLVRRYPVSGWCFVISAFILAGLPPAGVFFALESILGIIKTFSTTFWLITITSIGLMSFALLRTAGLLYLGRRFDFSPEESEYHPLSLILIVTLPTLALIVSVIHASPFLGGTVLLPFLEGTLPSIPAGFDEQKLSSALLLFVTAQPAIISAAVYAQRKFKKEQKVFPKISSILSNARPEIFDKFISFVIEDVFVIWVSKTLKIVADLTDIITYKISSLSIVAVSLALIFIMILGGS